MSEQEQEIQAPAKGKVLFKKKDEPGESITLSLGDLQQLIAASSNSGKEESKALVDAVLQGFSESRKPYKDPQREKVMKAVRKKMREGLLREELNNEIKQSRCPHVQGTLGRIPSPLTAIIQHTLDNGSTIGICLICQRIFLPHDEDYMQQMQRPSGCEPSSSGRRFVSDQQEAMKVGFDGYKHHDHLGKVVRAPQ